MGIQACPLPTALLSTHPGGFGSFRFFDFTENMEDYASQWAELGLDFDCLYSGFLGSAKQIDIVLRLFRQFRKPEDQIIVVDPVMGDHGRLYSTYTTEMQHGMRLLVEQADIITPNLTEAFFLLGEQYTDEPLDEQEMKRLLRKLSETGPGIVVITSVKTKDGRFANIGYYRCLDTYWLMPYDYINAQYPGTGDIFTSVLTGGLLQGNSLPEAMMRATQFVSLAVRKTYESGTPSREGVLLEKTLSWFWNETEDSIYERIR
jgi:pyridoxine kinase